MKARESATNEREKRVLAAKAAVETRKCPELGTAHQKSIMTMTRALLVRSRKPHKLTTSYWKCKKKDTLVKRRQLVLLNS